jgi:hypothetical protein
MPRLSSAPAQAFVPVRSMVWIGLVRLNGRILALGALRPIVMEVEGEGDHLALLYQLRGRNDVGVCALWFFGLAGSYSFSSGGWGPNNLARTLRSSFFCALVPSEIS